MVLQLFLMHLRADGLLVYNSKEIKPLCFCWWWLLLPVLKSIYSLSSVRILNLTTMTQEENWPQASQLFPDALVLATSQGEGLLLSIVGNSRRSGEIY